jgi:hypothetical protein
MGLFENGKIEKKVTLKNELKMKIRAQRRKVKETRKHLTENQEKRPQKPKFETP